MFHKAQYKVPCHLLYNDLCNVSDLLSKILYADDTSVLIRGRDLDHVINVLNSELHLLSNWLKANKLSLNAEKTFYMVFHRAKLKHKNIQILFDNVTLSEVASLKYLGLIIDNKLKWIDHIAHIKKKVSRGIGIISKAESF